MGDLGTSIWQQLGAIYGVGSFVQIALGGGLAIFKPWTPSEDDVGKRVDLKKQILQETLNKDFHNLLSRVVDLDPTKLRGSPPDRDLIGDFTSELFRIVTICAQLTIVQRRIRAAHNWLFATAAIGVIAWLLAHLIVPLRPWVGLTCCAAIAIQLVVVGCARRCVGRLEDYEKTT